MKKICRDLPRTLEGGTAKLVVNHNSYFHRIFLLRCCQVEIQLVAAAKTFHLC